MRKLYFILLCQGIFSGLKAQNLPSYLPANGLVGWWPFNGNAQDVSINNLNSISSGAEYTADRFGNPNSSIKFINNGSVKTLCPQSLSPASSSSYSVNFWFFKTIHNTGGRLFFQYKEGALAPAGTSNFDFFESGGTICPTGNVMMNHYPSSEYTCSPTIPSINSWHNVTIIFSQSDNSAKIFLDGNHWFSAPLNNNFPSEGYIIFGNNTTDEFPFVGILDDFAIYNRALTQQEITQLYQSGNETSLSYQLSQEKLGNCNDSPVKLSVQTSVKVKTDSAGSIGSSSATAYGNILNDGGKTITRRGFCWGTSANPTLSNSFSENGSGSGTFSGSLSSLNPSTTYHLRAYAGAPTEVWYGNEISFTTASGSASSANCGAPNIHNPNLSYGSMTDQDGNSYKTIVIGTQEWMAENLKVNHFQNGDPILKKANQNEWSGMTSPAYCWYQNDSASYDCPFGKMYNWYAAADNRNLCPAGWHVPNEGDWNSLQNFLGVNLNDGGKLKSRSSAVSGSGYWNAPDNGTDNQSGFSALPNGYRNSMQFEEVANLATFWCSDEFSSSWGVKGNHRLLGFVNGTGPNFFKDESFNFKSDGYAIRCLKDAPETGSINSLDCGGAVNTGTIYAGQAVSGANTTINYTGGNGGSYSSRVITSTGVSGLTATLVAGNFASGDGSLVFSIVGTPEAPGIASFALNIGGQSCSFSRPVYSILATASCGAPNVHNPNLNYGTMTDQAGNSYKTIVIGTQEWMAENLKTGRYLNGDSIAEIFKFPNEFDSYSDCRVGALYKQNVIDDARGLCPAGWTLPTENDWLILQNQLGGEIIAGGKMKSIDPLSWATPNVSSDNSSGLSLVGATEYYQFRTCDDFNPPPFSPGGVSSLGAWWISGGGYTRVTSYSAEMKIVSSDSIGLFFLCPSLLGVRCVRAYETGSINSIDCGAAVNSGTLFAGQAASDASTSINYIGGNGGSYSSRVITSTGVSGLTATLVAGNFASGDGNLIFSISGTPEAPGIASFALNIGGQSCSFTRLVVATGSGVTDIDGNTYGSVIIGNQEWMTENLKVSRYRNGDSLPTNLSQIDWLNTISGAYSIYNNDPVNNAIYGKLYNWYAVSDPRGLCPVGWFSPTNHEWNLLAKYLDPAADTITNSVVNTVAGGAMKALSSLWTSPNGGANNSSGFKGIPGGHRFAFFEWIGTYGFWWSSTNYSLSSNAMRRRLDNTDGDLNKSSVPKTFGLSVRCLKD